MSEDFDVYVDGKNIKKATEYRSKMFQYYLAEKYAKDPLWLGWERYTYVG